MQNVSGGISEALITTKYGLIVAIPALIIHVFLSRMARSVIDTMEKSGVAFVNQVMKASPGGGERAAVLPEPSPDKDSPSDKDVTNKKEEDSIQANKKVAADEQPTDREEPAVDEPEPELVESAPSK